MLLHPELSILYLLHHPSTSKAAWIQSSVAKYSAPSVVFSLDVNLKGSMKRALNNGAESINKEKRALSEKTQIKGLALLLYLFDVYPLLTDFLVSVADLHRSHVPYLSNSFPIAIVRAHFDVKESRRWQFDQG